MEHLLQPVLRLTGFHPQMAEALAETHSMALPMLLEGFNPCLTGSFAVGLALPDSDLDFVCEAHDMGAFEQAVRDAFSDCTDFDCVQKEMRGGPACVATFESPNGYSVELIGQPVPVKQNYAYLRMLVTARLLALAGKEGRDALLKLKKNGVTTDEALAVLFGIDSAPMDTLYAPMAMMDDEELQAFIRFDRMVVDGLV
ncbi:MAG: DUF4269 domain-containing protein [Proteobacteria bacterium]|nr:DUF4269 domain-containing protein [Pseudomonadota bacterium]